jgi:tRNA G18 (ribose-2'-O)-methylase SpoU
VPRHDPKPKSHDTAEGIQGLRAGLAVFARRPQDIVRIVYARSVRYDILELARWAGSRGIPCAETDDREIDRLAGSSHHEGLFIECRPRRWTSVHQLCDQLTRSRGVAVALDRVRNPYNVGAILRTAAFFAVDGIVLGTPAPDPGLASTAVRVAEGGAEELPLSRTTDLAETLARLRSRGVRTIGTDAKAQTSALGFAFSRPTVLVVGNEREGLGDRVRKECDSLVAIRGQGRIESLNVAVAASLLIAEAMKPAAR